MDSAWDVSLLCQNICVLSSFSRLFSLSAVSCSRIFLCHHNDVFGSQFLLVKSLLSELGVFFSCGNDVAFLKTDLMSILWKYIMN